MFKTGLISLIMILTIGCVGTPSYPDWSMQIPTDTQRYIYGMREGLTKDEAITNALNEIASKIHISIESNSSVNINIRTTKNQEEYTTDRRQTTNNYVEKIEFSNYKIKKEKRVSKDRYIVLVQIDKILNAKLLLNKIDMDIEKYQQLLSSNDENPINRIKTYQNARDKIRKRNLLDCSIVSKLMPNTAIDNRVSKLLKIAQEMKSYQSNILFSISGNNKAYQDVLKKEIAKKGFRVSNKDANIVISMQIQEKKITVLGNKILKSTIKLNVISGGNIIGQSRISVGAKSRISYQQAREFTLRSFERRLKEQKIIKNIIGI
jgi:hypothetical protein